MATSRNPIRDEAGKLAGVVSLRQAASGVEFRAASKAYDAMDGHCFVTVEAARRAVEGFGRSFVRQDRLCRVEVRA